MASRFAALARRPSRRLLSGALRPSVALGQQTHSRAGRPQSGSGGAGGGFSYPGPRRLDKIVKVQLLNKHGTPRVREIWNEYHKDHKTAVGDSLTADEHSLLMQRSRRCAVFVLPVAREGGYFTLLVQFQDQYCMCTYLEEFKRDPAGALPYVTYTMFGDMLEKKRVALVRGEVSNQMTVGEAGKIWELIKTYYLGPRHLFDDVVAFNEKSEDFDFQKVLGIAQITT